MAACPYEWRFLKKGETLPQDAVFGGTTKFGDIYIGQGIDKLEGQIGRITVHTEGMIPNQTKRMDKFTYHGDGSWFGIKDCQVLCTASNNKIEWIDCSRRHPIPANAVYAGTTSKDGKTYVGRSTDTADYRGDIGKINTENNSMYNFWCQSYNWSGSDRAQLLTISTPFHRASAIQPVIATVVPQPAIAAVVPQPEHSQPQRPQDIEVPSAPRDFAGLNNVSEKELQTMRANPLLVDNWLMDQKEVKEYTDRAQRLRQENAELAHGILAKESDFLNTQRTYENSSQDLATTQSRVANLVEQRSRILQQRSPDEKRRVLDASAQHHDSVAEQSLQSTLMTSGAFENGKLAEFRQAYLKNKTETHRMKALGDRLQKAGPEA